MTALRTPHAPIRFERVWKHYRIGSNDSLRDVIPAMLKRWTGRNGHHAADHSGFWALRDVSFEVRAGQTLGLIGHNGAGKSTVLKLLSKITTQTKGSVSLHGRLAALIELGGGFHPDLDGAENIYLQGTMLGLSRRQIKQSFDSIVAFSELESFLQTPVKRYSSGMVVRLGFAIAAHVHPDVLLLDEVLAVGDLAFQQKCFARIAELKAMGVTMIFISHDLDTVQKLCDRVLVLRDGAIVSEGEPAEMIRRYRDEVFVTRRERPTLQQAGRSPEAMVIERVSLCDRQGRIIESLPVGEALGIELELRPMTALREPNIRLSLERIDGLVCHVASWAPSPSDGANGQNVRLKLDYPSITLTPNLYQPVIEIFEGRSPIPVAMGRGALFQVTAQDNPLGAVMLEHRWSCGRNPAGSGVVKNGHTSHGV